MGVVLFLVKKIHFHCYISMVSESLMTLTVSLNEQQELDNRGLIQFEISVLQLQTLPHEWPSWVN